MGRNRSEGKLFLYGLLSLILFLGLIQIFISGKPLFLVLESFGLFFLLILTIIGFVGYKSGWGESVLFFMFLLYMINLSLVWFVYDSLYLVLFLLSLLGFLYAIPYKGRQEKMEKPVEKITEEEPHSVVFDEPVSEKDVPEVVTVSAKKTVAKKKVSAVKHSPGKFLASKSSNVYHVPKCEWAKRIQKTRRVWFKKKEDAWEKGYKSHSCV